MSRLAALMIFLAGCSGVGATLESFLYSPETGGYTLPTDVIPSHRDLSIPVSDGVTVTAAWVDGTTRADVTLLYFHGQASNIGSAWKRLELLYPLGYNLAVLDYRGYGLSTGKPSEPGIQLDLRAFRQTLLDQLGADPGKLVYYGRSLGGAMAIDLASTDAPAVLITESTFTSVQALISDGSGFDLPRSFVSTAKWDSLAKIANIDAPYLVLHGTADDYVQTKYAPQLIAAHPGPEELVLVPGANHGDDPGVPDTLGYDTYRKIISDYVGAVLP
jgi:pimeloyl-ACP methyl ester carboxylesterase